MKLLLQRVAEARVDVAGQTVGEIGQGLLIFHCAEAEDRDEDLVWFANKISKLRIFPDSNGKTNLSLMDFGGSALLVSQFTLAADWRKGNRPGFSRAAPPDQAQILYERFGRELAALGIPLETGRFGADMQVSLINDGPFTLFLDSHEFA